MPILDIEIVTAETLERDLANRLADLAGQVFDSPPGGTWVRLRALPPHEYAENASAHPEGWRSVFVTVRKAQPLAGQALEIEIRALTEGLARICQRQPEHIHILYEPALRGRIAFGGRLQG